MVVRISSQQLLSSFLEGLTTVYLVINVEGVTGGVIPVKGYAGVTGRLDEIARDFVSIIHSSSGVISYLGGPPNPPRLLLYAPRICNKKIDAESKVMDEIRLLYLGKRSCIKSVNIDLNHLFSLMKKRGFKTIYLTEDAGDYDERILDKSLLVMGAHIDIPLIIFNQINEFIELRMRIGPLSYQASQVISYIEFLKEVCGNEDIPPQY